MPEAKLSTGASAAQPSQPSRRFPIHNSSRLLWPLVMVLFGLWVAIKLGAFSLSTDVPLANGSTTRFPNTFASIDHPFHAARARQLQQSLADGELLRWMSSHQGGYPVEFYPLGAAWIDVLIWALSFGALSMMSAHKLAIVAIFLAPGLAYYVMARRDRHSPLIALSALIAHVAVPGGDAFNGWDGGYAELVQWGLVTNVAASVALLFVLSGLGGFLLTGSRWSLVGAVMSAAFAVATNPRSMVALGVIGVGVLAAYALMVSFRRAELTVASGRLVLVGALSALLSAPVLISLARFRDDYRFIRYSQYDDLEHYWQASIHAVSAPVFALGLIGVVLALTRSDHPMLKIVAVVQIAYIAVTILFVVVPEGTFIRQLEATRLMPFQRLLTTYLAGATLYTLLQTLLRLKRPVLVESLQALLVLAFALAYLGPAGSVLADQVPPDQRAFGDVAMTDEEAMVGMRDAVQSADRLVPQGSALYILGSEVSWHQQLWAPFWTARPLLFDDWLWSWHGDLSGPVDRLGRNNFEIPRLRETLSDDFLHEHGVGAVVVSDAYRPLAEASAALEEGERFASFSVFLVLNPSTFVSADSSTVTLTSVSNHTIEAVITGSGGEVAIDQNWFPRWRAEVNGERVDVRRRDDGTMAVTVPAGTANLELTYIVDGWDWLARSLSLLALLALVALWWNAVSNRARPLIQPGKALQRRPAA